MQNLLRIPRRDQAVVERKILPGDMIIIRYEGPRGYGMSEMLMTTEAIGHVSPEAAAGGPLAFVEEGDILAYSVKNRRLTLSALTARRWMQKRLPLFWRNGRARGSSQDRREEVYSRDIQNMHFRQWKAQGMIYKLNAG